MSYPSTLLSYISCVLDSSHHITRLIISREMYFYRTLNSVSLILILVNSNAL